MGKRAGERERDGTKVGGRLPMALRLYLTMKTKSKRQPLKAGVGMERQPTQHHPVLSLHQNRRKPILKIPNMSPTARNFLLAFSLYETKPHLPPSIGLHLSSFPFSRGFRAPRTRGIT
ncbi:unnamed protein product [Victoria cruziana]